MGQSQGRMTPAHAAEMACMMDPAPGEDDRCPEMSEQAFHWMEKGLKSVAKDATPMIRASVVDLRASDPMKLKRMLRITSELGEDAGVLGGDQVGGAQHVERPQRDVAQVADRRCDDMQAGRDPAGRRFTSRLLVASL